MRHGYIASMLSRLLPRSVDSSQRGRKKDWKRLYAVKRVACRADNLRCASDFDLNKFLRSFSLEGEWEELQKRIAGFGIPDGTGGVNPGDRRALYYLTRNLKPATVLEVGTHIGASTVHIASALKMNREETGTDIHLKTLDIVEVNSVTERRWEAYGVRGSPGEMIHALGCDDSVEFVTGDSLGYLKTCNQRFDLIFLDGDHAARAVYQEIPLALELLNPDGVILLHDYFPGLQPLWSNGAVITGPYLGVARLREEGAPLTVLPLGELPWPTKLNSNVTSLALLARNQ